MHETTCKHGIQRMGCPECAKTGGQGSPASTCSLPSHFRGPFKHHASVGIISDGNGTRVLDVRAWGYLTGLGDGGCKIPQGPAVLIQDQLGEWVAAALTEAANDKALAPPTDDTKNL